MAFHWHQSDCKFPQVSRTHLNTLTDLKIAVVWMVSVLSVISTFPSLFTWPRETVPTPSTTISITVTFKFQFFQLSDKIQIFVDFFFSFLSFLLYGPFKCQNPLINKFFFSWLFFGLLAEIGWSICILKFLTILCLIF